MRLVFLLMLYFFCHLGYSQKSSIDTTNHSYRKELEKMYLQRTSKTKRSFKSISDIKIRDEVSKSYIEMNEDFIEKIKKGVFVKDTLYSEFLNEIVQRLAIENTDFPQIKNTKILLSFSDIPNAYAIGDDFIIVTLPLLKSINNEYELAFIIGHEIAHNILSHSYNGLLDYAQTVHSSEIKKQTRAIEKRKYDKGSYASALYKEIVYGKRKNSRKLEQQADSLGFLLYRKAFKGYEHYAIQSLETLDKIDFETDSLTIADYARFFSTEKLQFKAEWLNNDEISGYKYDKSVKYWLIDSLKTHADCALRTGFMKKEFQIHKTLEKKNTAIFDSVKKNSFYDYILGLFVIEDYGKSLYETLLFLKKEPENSYLKNLVYFNLVKIQEAQKAYTLNRHLDNVNPNYSQSYNRYLSFIRELRKSELNEFISYYSLQL